MDNEDTRVPTVHIEIGGPMIDDTQLEHWKTKAEASEILKCSEKTISRLAAQKLIQKLMRRNPGRRAQPVFSPDDIEALRGDQDQIEAFPVATERNAPGTALARRDTAVSTVGVLAQLLADRLSPAPRVPVERKVLLNLREAAEYSGMPKAWLVREIKAGELKAIKAGGWRIRRSDLEQI